MLRESKVIEQMELLDITDITTPRQSRNGTVVWRLPIKDQDTGILIEVASFKSGYVRNQGKSCHSNFQLNKRCENEAEYFKLPNGDYRKFTTRGCVLIPKEIDRLEYLISYCLKNYYIKNANRIADGDYRKYTGKERVLIPIEIDRLEYLISYCLKNYYIKHANFVPDGEYVPKWRYDNLADAAKLDYKDKSFADKYKTDKLIELRKEIRDLENKLQSIIRTARH